MDADLCEICGSRICWIVKPGSSPSPDNPLGYYTPPYAKATCPSCKNRDLLSTWDGHKLITTREALISQKLRFEPRSLEIFLRKLLNEYDE